MTDFFLTDEARKCLQEARQSIEQHHHDTDLIKLPFATMQVDADLLSAHIVCDKNGMPECIPGPEWKMARDALGDFPNQPGTANVADGFDAAAAWNAKLNTQYDQCMGTAPSFKPKPALLAISP
jgi:hypothetical protein